MAVASTLARIAQIGNDKLIEQLSGLGHFPGRAPTKLGDLTVFPKAL